MWEVLLAIALKKVKPLISQFLAVALKKKETGLWEE